MGLDSFKDDGHFKHGINLWTGEPNKPVFYTKEMAQKIRDIKCPVNNLEMNIVQYPDFLTIRLYEDNFMKYDGQIKLRVIDYIEMVKKLIESYGVRCELEGVPSKNERMV